MMHLGKILISAIVGTSAMTLFSYLISNKKNRNFREPQVLGQLIKRLPKSGSKKSAQIAGWGLHYAIGTLFVVCYSELWQQTKVKPSLTSGTLLGAGSGLIGIGGWKLMFEAHPNPPAKNLKPYFGHLILAHIVFGIFCAITYKITDGNKRA
ncbi:hypothetical protein LB467_00035 [Salegentibacter sp. JZCK2]|uniref:hypothetical protein n=1 Tax=Salegentibacter tibetensis TaxID=2873600 RepID=UPI001CC9513D|nr:hypothetical protein [Salegentibacter tibetensis]MBZ9728067.1 hypothetical protein [Salegentibacter tibetensis]